jgi:hypothetical protein
MERLPYIDEHRRQIGASPAEAWAALQHVVAGYFDSRLPPVVVRAWGLQPAGGFAIAEQDPPRRLVLRGRHRFARYQLAFTLDAQDDGVIVSAHTNALFPGVKGRLYRALVIDSRLHVLATRRVLRQVAAAAQRHADGRNPATRLP